MQHTPTDKQLLHLIHIKAFHEGILQETWAKRQQKTALKNKLARIIKKKEKIGKLVGRQQKTSTVQLYLGKLCQ